MIFLGSSLGSFLVWTLAEEDVLFSFLVLLVFFRKVDQQRNLAKVLMSWLIFSNATLTDDGSRECVNTTGMMEIYEKTPVYECVHKTEEQCHYTYVTQFEPTRQEECEENYEKSCQVVVT